MLLMLVRHALTPVTGVRLYGKPPGPSLSERGREQARAVSERLAPVGIDAVYSSHAQRAVETAQPIAASKRLRLRVRDGLEDVHYGAWEGRSLKALAATKQWRAVLAHPSEGRFPGGETLAETQARVLGVLRKIIDAHPRGRVAVVTHADPIRLAIAHYAGMHVDHFMRLQIAPASVSALWLGSGHPRILKVNDTGSVTDLAGAKR